MRHAHFQVPPARNEEIRNYEPGSPDRKALQDKLVELRGKEIEIPVVIGGKEIRTGDTFDAVEPHEHGHRLAVCHKAGADHVAQAAEAAAEAWKEWSETPFEDRAAVFLKAADLLTGPRRSLLNAATILGQSKTPHQAEIEAACELADFWRFNAEYAEKIYHEQPASPPGQWNRVEYRPLEGFVFAITPFNFTAIAGNLPTAPALMGNTVLWKPATSSIYSSWYLVELLREAGLPEGVINFLPGSGGQVGNPAVDHPQLAGVHFTGSTEVFRGIWSRIGQNIANYSCYPRIVGETGGKDFVFAHPSASVQELVIALVRGAFEYQGQKCSAASRAYIPQSLWAQVKEGLVEQTNSLKMGDPKDFTNFMGAVIDKNSFTKIAEYIEYAKQSSDAEIIAGGEVDGSVGYFVRPTVIEAKDPRFKTMCEEIFGPVLTVYVYPDDQLETALDHCDQDAEYALTGAIFGRERPILSQLAARLRHTAGNFYINDKPTGAVVGQQPFGGSRASGTNDKAGSQLNLLRWVSPRTIKEVFAPPTDYRYPYMGEDENDHFRG